MDPLRQFGKKECRERNKQGKCTCSSGSSIQIIQDRLLEVAYTQYCPYPILVYSLHWPEMALHRCQGLNPGLSKFKAMSLLWRQIMKASEMLQIHYAHLNQKSMKSQKLTCMSFSHLGLLQHSDSTLDSWVREWLLALEVPNLFLAWRRVGVRLFTGIPGVITEES